MESLDVYFDLMLSTKKGLLAEMEPVQIFDDRYRSQPVRPVPVLSLPQ
jgi:hypothetical protein